MGFKMGFSIGYNTIKSDWSVVNSKDVRYLKEIAVEEVSIVPHPLNKKARATSIKTDAGDPELEYVKHMLEKHKDNEDIKGAIADIVKGQPGNSTASKDEPDNSTQDDADIGYFEEKINELLDGSKN